MPPSPRRELLWRAWRPWSQPSGADIRAMVKELGAMKVVLDQAERGDLADPYGALGLEVSYKHA